MTTSGDKQRLFATLRHEPTDAIPWVPFAGVHAGALKGYTATDVLTDADKLFEVLMEVNRLYDPDGQPVLFDLQIEAEILGCELLWADKAPPSVASHPLAEDAPIPTHLPEPTDGRLPLVLDVMRRMKQAVGDRTALYGLVCGPFTLASHLRGTEIFMDMMMNPDGVNALLAYTNAVIKRIAGFYVEAGIDVIAVVDPLVSQIGPKHFAQFLDTPMSDLFADIRRRGVFSSFFVCGDATKNIEAMCKTGPDSIGIDENIDMSAAKQVTDRYNVAIGGNIPLTTVMLLGSQADNMKWVIDWQDQLTGPNLILAPGCDMPYDIPPENVIGAMQAIRQPDETRLMLANYRAPDIFDIPVELPDYANLQRPLVEVFTLDSETCAACTYMFGAAMRAVKEIGTPIDIVEYKFTRRENVARCMKMGVKNLPSIYINGQLKYSSIIPSNDELLEVLRQSVP
jgi:uroporphyrinogen decarboxylase